jgi:hypothetical protein
MKKRFAIIIIIIFSVIFLAGNCTLPAYSQTRIINICKQILADSGEHHLGTWIVKDKRVSIDTLVKICSPNISQFDTVRFAIFYALSEIKDTSILNLMSVKAVSGNSIEKLSASAYIYQYYGIKMKVGQDIPLASFLFLFNTTADKLKNKNSTLYNNIEQKREIANTFPQSENLYYDFILNQNYKDYVRAWFVKSLLEAQDREIASAFLMDLMTELNEKDPIHNVVSESVYTLMNTGTGGGWIAQ